MDLLQMIKVLIKMELSKSLWWTCSTRCVVPHSSDPILKFKNGIVKESLMDLMARCVVPTRFRSTHALLNVKHFLSQNAICTLYIKHRTLYIIHWTLYNVHLTSTTLYKFPNVSISYPIMQYVHRTLNIVHWTSYIEQCTLYIEHWTLYILQAPRYISFQMSSTSYPIVLL